MEKFGTARQATGDDIIRNIRFACRITKARIQTHAQICNTYCFSTAKIVTRTRLSGTLYVHCLSCVSFNCNNSAFYLVCTNVGLMAKMDNSFNVIDTSHVHSLPHIYVTSRMSGIRYFATHMWFDQKRVQ